MADSRIYCTRCFRFGHVGDKCWFTQDANGDNINDSESESEIDEIGSSEEDELCDK